MHYLGRLEVASLKRGGTTSEGKTDMANIFDAIQNTANEHLRLLMMYENAMWGCDYETYSKQMNELFTLILSYSEGKKDIQFNPEVIMHFDVMG